MNLESSKNLGGVGALLIVIASVGLFGQAFVGLLGLVGIILVLIALKGISDYYQEAGIFNNALYAIIIAIIGLVAFVGAIVASVLMFLSNLPIELKDLVEKGDWASFAAKFPAEFTNMNVIWTLVGTIIIALVVLFIFAIIAMVFFRKSLGLLSSKTGVGLFGTAGLLMLIGAVLTIIIIGFLLIWIGWILLIVAFFTVRTQAAPTQTPPPPTA